MDYAASSSRLLGANDLAGMKERVMMLPYLLQQA
jgi:hypothetical protein